MSILLNAWTRIRSLPRQPFVFKLCNMGKMKEVWQLKQDLIAIDEAYKDVPDTFFMDFYLSMKNIEKKAKDTEDNNPPAQNNEEDELPF